MNDQPGQIEIFSSDSKTSARIRADVGFNCFSFTVPAGDKVIETLWSEPTFADGIGRPSRSGIPILFPFAGRIDHGQYSWRGTEYSITTAGTSDVHAIHGFVYTRPWRVIGQTSESVTGAFQGSIDAPETLADWPADYAIELTWRVSDRSLSADVTITNPGDTDLPFVFGLHPYFRLPLGGTSADECLVTVPAAAYRELENLLPTGREFPIDPSRDVRSPRRFAEIQLDDVVTGLEPSTNGIIETRIHDPVSGLTLVQSFSTAHPFVVVFTPPHREAIAIEPYTGAPDPFAAMKRGDESHLTVLGPGATWQATYCISIEG